MAQLFDPNRICRMCLSTNIGVKWEAGLHSGVDALKCVCRNCGYFWVEQAPSEEEYEAARSAAAKGPTWEVDDE